VTEPAGDPTIADGLGDGDDSSGEDIPDRPLRRGWTTGACATAAAKAAYTALLTGRFPDPVTITLPRALRPSFRLATEEIGPGYARAGVVKDAGDDPDVTHGVLVVVTVRPLAAGSGLEFRAGEGVGTVTLPGLPLEVGEPAINPAPRRMIELALREAAQAARLGSTPEVEVPDVELPDVELPDVEVPDVEVPDVEVPDVEVEVSIPAGRVLAAKTWNPRLGIVGGLSVLGTTGVVVPYSCSAWIHSIHRGIDVARAAGHRHVAGCTGSTSEAALQTLFGLPDTALLDMGDFVGDLLRYVRRHPVERLSIGGGFAKLSKLAVGQLDLHSARSQIDRDWLAARLREVGGDASLGERARGANSALAILQSAGPLAPALAEVVAVAACEQALEVLKGSPVGLDVVVVDRAGEVLARSGVRRGDARR
jgi:cobalt-precorrin-5B (C1)-methyltransferase